MINKSIFFFLITILFSISLKAQNISFPAKENISFSHYLMLQKEYSDAAYILQSITQNNLSQNLKDSINYLTAYSLMLSNQRDSSNIYYFKINKNASFFEKSRFLLSYNLIKKKKFNNAYDILNNLEIQKINLDLKHYNLAGIALLNRNLDLYNLETSKYKRNNPTLAQYSDSLHLRSLKIKKFKHRSLFLAGFMSATIPGLGKVYAGKYREGISAFFTVGALAAVTLENYFKSGIKDAKTIIFGSLFTVFYIGNIYGSVVSLKVKREEFNHEINHQIMLDIRIPLERILR